MIIGSHGMTHSILISLKEPDLTYELGQSKSILERKLQEEIECFSIPRGFYDNRIIREAKNSGYKAVFTSSHADTNGFKFGRIVVRASWDLPYFKTVLTKGLPFRYRAITLIKKSIIRVLGVNVYDQIRTIILT